MGRPSCWTSRPDGRARAAEVGEATIHTIAGNVDRRGDPAPLGTPGRWAIVAVLGLAAGVRVAIWQRAPIRTALVLATTLLIAGGRRTWPWTTSPSAWSGEGVEGVPQVAAAISGTFLLAS